MFLRIEGFQVEIKEINKTWDQAAFVKNFKIGKFWKTNVDVLKVHNGDLAVVLKLKFNFSQKQYLQFGRTQAKHILPCEIKIQK